jgi:hypothetical protein
MRKFFIAAVMILGLFTLGFSDDTNSGGGSARNFSVKAFGGYNLWPFGIGAQTAANALPSSASLGGFSFGGQFLFNIGSVLQLGAEVVYLPIFKWEESGVNVNFSAVPVDLTLNLRGGLFYTELGAGMAFGTLSGNITNSFINAGDSLSYNMFFLKLGSGLAIPITSNFDLDFGMIGYLPFTGPLDTSKFTIFAHFVLNLRAGVSINF